MSDTPRTDREFSSHMYWTITEASLRMWAEKLEQELADQHAECKEALKDAIIEALKDTISDIQEGMDNLGKENTTNNNKK